MKNIFNMKLAGSALRLKSSTLEGGIKAAQTYGRDIAALMA